MDIHRRFAVDKTKEQEGIWIDDQEGGRLKLGRLGNPRHRKAVAQKRNDYLGTKRSTVVPDDVSERISREAVAETILLDWENQTWNGEVVPYSRERALEWMTTMDDFYLMIVGLANDIENYRIDVQETVEKNS